MPPRQNPAKLNPLQLRTLTLLQAIARIPGASNKLAGGDILITQFPHAHGDHFHLGDAVVASRDATGLENQAVWNALNRKGMIKAEWPDSGGISRRPARFRGLSRRRRLL